MHWQGTLSIGQRKKGGEGEKPGRRGLGGGTDGTLNELKKRL